MPIIQMRPSDRQLEAIIREEFHGFDLRPEESLEVFVYDGVAKLSGRVYDKHVKAMAANLCWELSGVRDCLNQIILIAPSGLSARVGDPLDPDNYSVSNVCSVSGWIS